MSTKVTIAGPRTLSGIRRIGNEVKIKVAKQLATNETRRLGRESSKHYANAVKQIGNILRNPGIGSIGTGGPKSIRFTRVDGSMQTVRTAPWAPLKEAYAAQAPKSATFWKKTGALSTYFDFMAGPGAKATAKTVRFNITEKGIKVESEITFSRLPSPMDVLITKAFLTGAKQNGLYLPTPLSSKGINRFSVQRAAFAEADRPFVSRVTSALGGNLLKVLQRK